MKGFSRPTPCRIDWPADLSAPASAGSTAHVEYCQNRICGSSSRSFQPTLRMVSDFVEFAIRAGNPNVRIVVHRSLATGAHQHAAARLPELTCGKYSQTRAVAVIDHVHLLARHLDSFSRHCAGTYYTVTRAPLRFGARRCPGLPLSTSRVRKSRQRVVQAERTRVPG